VRKDKEIYRKLYLSHKQPQEPLSANKFSCAYRQPNSQKTKRSSFQYRYIHLFREIEKAPGFLLISVEKFWRKYGGKK